MSRFVNDGRVRILRCGCRSSRQFLPRRGIANRQLLIANLTRETRRERILAPLIPDP